MYEIVVTEDFINLIKDIPFRYFNILTNSFVSIKKIDSCKENTFLSDLLEQIKNQEIE